MQRTREEVLPPWEYQKQFNPFTSFQYFPHLYSIPSTGINETSPTTSIIYHEVAATQFLSAHVTPLDFIYYIRHTVASRGFQ